MPDSPDPAASLLAEALVHLAAHGIDVVLDRVGRDWSYSVEGVSLTEGEVIEKARVLGMLKTAAIQ